jgi:hypothetical protein
MVCPRFIHLNRQGSRWPAGTALVVATGYTGHRILPACPEGQVAYYAFPPGTGVRYMPGPRRHAPRSHPVESDAAEKRWAAASTRAPG